MLKDLKQDPAELVVLSVLADGRQYGYAITKQVAARSEGEMKLTPGVLYPLLTRLEKGGLISSSWETVRADADAPGRRRKWYTLTTKGRKRLEQRIHAHRAYTALIDAFLPNS